MNKKIRIKLIIVIVIAVLYISVVSVWFITKDKMTLRINDDKIEYKFSYEYSFYPWTESAGLFINGKYMDISFEDSESIHIYKKNLLRKNTISLYEDSDLLIYVVMNWAPQYEDEFILVYSFDGDEFFLWNKDVRIAKKDENSEEYKRIERLYELIDKEYIEKNAVYDSKKTISTID